MEYKVSNLKNLTTYIARGITPKYTEDKENGVVILNQKCIRDYKISFKEAKVHNIKDRNISNEKILKKYDILINSTGVGTAGRVAQYFESNCEISVDSHVTIVRPDKTKINPLYLGYAIKEQQSIIEQMAEGSTGQTEISRNRLGEEILIKYPKDINIQRKIANILYTIDKRIKLNNKINDNLLKVGLILVNEYSNNVNNEIELNRVIKFIKGKKPKIIGGKKQENQKKYLTIACLNGQELKYANTNKMIISDNDLLMVMDGASSGDVYYSDSGVVGSTLAKIDIINDKFKKGYIYFCIKKHENLIKSKNTGSAIPHTDKTFVGNLHIPKIDINQQKEFDILLNKIQQNQKENEILMHLRETLLPKLMNGEIDLNKIKT